MTLFHSITPQDESWARPLLESTGYFSCEFSFTNIFIWQDAYQSRIARWQDTVLVCGETPKALYALFPAGADSWRQGVEVLLHCAAEVHKPLVIYSVPLALGQPLQQAFSGRVTLSLPRGHADYLYSLPHYAAMSGKAFQNKRTDMHHFKTEHPDAAFLPLHIKDFDAVLRFVAQWQSQYHGHDLIGISHEYRAIQLALQHYEELRLVGGALYAEGEIVAVNLGSRLNNSVLCGHIQKARREMRGIYPTVSQRFVQACGNGYRWLNCEDDLDDPGLRQAKLSYQPAWIEQKYQAFFDEAGVLL